MGACLLGEVRAPCPGARGGHARVAVRPSAPSRSLVGCAAHLPWSRASRWRCRHRAPPISRSLKPPGPVRRLMIDASEIEHISPVGLAVLSSALPAFALLSGRWLRPPGGAETAATGTASTNGSAETEPGPARHGGVRGLWGATRVELRLPHRAVGLGTPLGQAAPTGFAHSPRTPQRSG